MHSSLLKFPVAWIVTTSILLAGPAGSSLSAQSESDALAAQEAPTPDVKLLREALLTVQIGERVQVGVLLTPTRCVTSFGSLSKGVKLDVRPLGTSKVVKAKCIAADKTRDLALLELEFPQPKLEPSAPPAVETAPAPREASAAKERFALTKDSDVSAFDGGAWTMVCDPRRPDVVTAAPASEWVEDTEAARVFRADEHALLRGGLPIVDAEGGLIGLWRWSAPGEPAQIVEAAFLRKFAERAPAAEGLVFDGADHPRPLVFPLLAVPRPKKEDPSLHAISLAGDLREKVKCDRCDAKGRWEQEFERKWNGREWQIKKEWVTCKTCTGDRVARPAKVQDQVEKLAEAVVTTAPSESKRERLKASLENGLREAAELDLAKFSNYVKDRAREKIVNGGWMPGESIAFVLPAAHWPLESDPRWGTNVRVVESPPEPRFRRLLFVDPDDRNLALESCDAFVFAALSGHAKLGGHTYTVLERAVIVPIKSPGDVTGK